MSRGKFTGTKIGSGNDDARTYRGNHLTVTTANARVFGNHCTITGPNAQVWGNHNNGTGPNIKMWGNHNVSTGPNAMMHGNYCTGKGPNCMIVGRHGSATGPNSRVRNDSGTTVACGVGHAEARDGGVIEFSGSDFLIDNGSVTIGGSATFNSSLTLPRRSSSSSSSSSVRDTKSTGGNIILGGRTISASDASSTAPRDDDGVYTNNVVFSGSGMVVTISKDGRPYARYEGSGNIDRMTNGRLIVDGVDITDACRIAPPSAAASSSSSAAAPSGRKRKSEGVAPPPKRVLPDGHRCTEAKDGEKECAVCQDNRVDARLDPCGHTTLCVDCAAKIYSDATQRRCPICNKGIEHVDVVFL